MERFIFCVKVFRIFAENFQMDSFIRRLKYYGIGFGIGLFFVFFFFQNRGCSWLPANRVKNSFLDRVIVLPESQLKLMREKNLTKEDIINVLNDGEVVFDKSAKQGQTKVYLIEKEFDSKGAISFFFTLPKESFISEVHFAAKTAQNVSEKAAYKVKNSTSGFGEILHFPKEENLIFVDTAKFVTCQQEALGLINALDIFSMIKKNGRIDFSKTQYGIRPKPEQFLVFNDKKNREIGCKAIWYKNKINITAFELPFKSDCK